MMSTKVPSFTQSTFTVLVFLFKMYPFPPHRFPLAFVKRYIENIYSGAVLPMLHDVSPPLSEQVCIGGGV